MADNLPAQVRSRTMAAVRSKGNRTTELALSECLRVAGLCGYRKHWAVEGRPDFAWPSLRVAVFVDGCFWHGCTCKRMPKTNQAFWRKKIGRNRDRDKHVSGKLRRAGWAVIRIKECQVRRPAAVNRIVRALARKKPTSTGGDHVGL
jgi:DNA mismatch endonuclease (patch repair protein)